MTDNNNISINVSTTTPPKHRFLSSIVSFLIYTFSILVYLRPISSSTHLITSPSSQLDELHIMSESNADINGSIDNIDDSSWDILTRIFENDYWGRNMNEPSSHKSYRPITVLSFRYGRGIGKALGWSDLYTHRIVNIVLHGALVQMVGILGVRILSPLLASSSNHTIQNRWYTTMCVSILLRLMVSLHPTHVETVVNAANRAHLLGLVLSVWELDVGLNVVILGLVHLMALLSCETVVFMLPAVVLTWIWMVVAGDGSDDDDEEEEEEEDQEDDGPMKNLFYKYYQYYTTPAIRHRIRSTNLLLRILTISVITSAWLYYRHSQGWFSIPEGLIRPAENPFYTFEGWRRFVNYSYVLCIHLSKALGMGLTDWVGFNHEYGFDCIPELGAWRKVKDDGDPVGDGAGERMIGGWVDALTDDFRWIVPLGFVGGFVVVSLWCLRCLTRLLERGGGQQIIKRRIEIKGKDAKKEVGGKRTNGQKVDTKKKTVTSTTKAILLLLTAYAWIATLFPISGIVRVGTFVADRIVLPSSLVGCVIWSCVGTFWIMKDWNDIKKEESSDCASDTDNFTKSIDHTKINRRDAPANGSRAKTNNNHNDQPIQHQKTNCHRTLTTVLKFVPLFLWTIYSAIKIDRRSLEWMDSKSLLESSVRTCPRNAKSHMELSKIHSGLYPPPDFNLDKSLEYLEKAEEIDPNFCDVNYQFAFVYLQKEMYSEFEERIIKGVLCPFTMMQSYELFQKYWASVLNADRGGQGRDRYNKYTRIIEEAIEEERSKEKKL